MIVATARKMSKQYIILQRIMFLRRVDKRRLDEPSFLDDHDTCGSSIVPVSVN